MSEPLNLTAPEPRGPHGLRLAFRLNRYECCLVLLFLLSLPLCNPWVHGDGVGYYALARSLLIEHRLDFTKDWLEANPQFRMSHTNAEGRIPPGDYTATGHLANHFSIGPAILWAPFLIVAHAGVLLSDSLGAHIAPDGFSKPYAVTMALATAVYGFIGLWISFRIARHFVAERWAFLATIGIWFGTSLPVYMYFNPSWSHAQSEFTVASFLWYWLKTRNSRTPVQWIVLGLIAGLMLDVYYVTAILLLLPLFESLVHYRQTLSLSQWRTAAEMLLSNLLFAFAVVIAFLPTLVTKKIIFGSYLNMGYDELWFWNSPALWKAAFSSQHGVFSWTPIVLLAVAGLFLFIRRDRLLPLWFLIVVAVHFYAIGCFENWHGRASFGNRYFLPLTPLFCLGLAVFFDSLANALTLRAARITATALTSILVLWNFGMMYQWGTHLIPARGPISWREAVYNQFAVVPGQAIRTLERYFLRRSQLMQHIEDDDIRELKSHPSQ